MTKLYLLFIGSLLFIGCKDNSTGRDAPAETTVKSVEAPEYFNLRPKLEKEYGYSHAVRIGDDLRISGAVSMNDSGMIVAPGDMAQQMKNCYADLEKILQHVNSHILFQVLAAG